MTALQTADFPKLDAAHFPTDVKDWTHDLADHAVLSEKCVEVAKMQTEHMERMRLDKKAAPQFDADTEAAASKAHAELNRLDKVLGVLRREMYQIEARALTYVPQNAHDAKMLMGFISKVLEIGHDIKPDYLADIIATCAAVFIEADSPVQPIVH